jgi:tetratricopeptide (TPR) repeat protein
MNKSILIIFGIAIFYLVGCTKSEFLNEKPNSGIVVPSTLEDFSRLLDRNNSSSPALPHISSDDYFLPFTVWQGLTVITEKNAHIWAKDIYDGQVARNDWNLPYQAIFYANVVIEEFKKLPLSDQNSLNGKNILGRAFLIRAFHYLQLVQTFSPAYDESTAETDLGLPLRLSPDIDKILPRSSVKSTYDQIIKDLEKSLELTSTTFQAVKKDNESRAGIFGVLARTYLNMRKYDQARKFSDSALAISASLIEYNTLSTTVNNPFSASNIEVLFSTTAVNGYLTHICGTSSAVSVIEPALYNSYHSNDLRKSVFFGTGAGGLMNFKQGYNAAILPFTGVATDEMFLIRAECNARAGSTVAAMKDLNDLLKTRWRKNTNGTSTFIDITANTSNEALQIILQERRKELIWRCIRWSDLKRLNKEGANLVLTRVLNGVTYSLEPNSNRYVLPIPDDEIALSGIKQNPR